ncbi:ATP-binding cassette domain-containing protein [Candidatus Enterococcus ferrettii]|uniref:ABC transporter ATP-binding protein n=1 Tax=Candidatus Enterococcus ferrettii TaxID=2815324 RepID=A0ABV0ETQ7_9ENTE|nr:ATP-binding cassette domain-containing protein [Enterococcus sp. 665A]MBO1342445.1 ATP-binding cassette domain-containing protein [Enterococcus sp. 665A]
MLEMINVSKSYGEIKALRETTFSVQPGEIVGIVGKSGSGKTTLLRLLNLMEQPSSGKVLIDGVDVQTLSKKNIRQRQQHMGMIFQNYNLLENLKVYDNVALPLKLLKKQQPEKIQSLLEFVGMEHKAKSYPSQLSGGEKQRVSIARALSRDPKFLLCDEATSSLDEENTEAVVRLLYKTHQELKPIIFFVSHELETVKSLCERILVMENGQLVGEFKNNPRKFSDEKLSYLEKVERSLSL